MKVNIFLQDTWTLLKSAGTEVYMLSLLVFGFVDTWRNRICFDFSGQIIDNRHTLSISLGHEVIVRRVFVSKGLESSWTNTACVAEVHSSPPTTPHHSRVGPSRLLGLESPWSCFPRSSCFSPVCFQCGSLNVLPLELLPLQSPWHRSWSDAERTEGAAGDVSLLSVRRTPLSELHSLFESAPTAVTKQKRRVDRWWWGCCKQTPHEKSLAAQKSKSGTQPKSARWSELHRSFILHK